MTDGGMNLFGLEGRTVCANCFDDYGLQEFVAMSTSAHNCSYCNRTDPELIAAPLIDVIRYIHECFCREYDDAANGLGYCSAEGGYLGETFDAYDLLTDVAELELPNDAEGKLFGDLVGGIGGRLWSLDDPHGPRWNEVLSDSWNEFAEFVRRRRRFFFLDALGPRDPTDFREVLKPQEMLPILAEVVHCRSLLVTLPAGTTYFRTRPRRRSERFTTPLQLGAPPPSAAGSPSRMSPPGIPMTYVASDLETAVAETTPEGGVSSNLYLATAQFRTTRPIQVIDASRLPLIPSLFDSQANGLREAVRFFRTFVAEISKPVSLREPRHAAYVPTQIVIEYLRHRFPSADGLTYRSARRPGGQCTVLFLGRPSLVLTDTELQQLDNIERIEHMERGGFLELIIAGKRVLRRTP